MGDNKNKLNVIIAIGCLWGLSEAAGGLYLRGSCARFLSGSILVGTTIFFLSMGFSFGRRFLPVLLLPVIAAVFKLFDAALLHLPILHGEIINPIYGLFTETLAFIAILLLFASTLRENWLGRAMIGAFAALLAVNLFPTVGYVTGIPACTYQATQIPLSIWGAPVAIAASFLTCPLGFFLGEKLATVSLLPGQKKIQLVWLSSSALSLICLVGLLLLRL